MEKQELVSIVAEEAGVSPAEAVKIVEAFIEAIKGGLIKGEKVTISGFGTFSLAKRKAREFVNPKTKQVHELPERVVPHFKAGGNFQKV